MTLTDPTVDVQLLDHPVSYTPMDVVPMGGGGECVFLGRTRPETHQTHGALQELSYDAYRPMALRELRSLATLAIDRFGCLFVRIHHAVGIVPPGEASVLVQVACGHRAESFDACRFLIDELKIQVPIWKKEVWADGTSWSEGTSLPPEEAT